MAVALVAALLGSSAVGPAAAQDDPAAAQSAMASLGGTVSAPVGVSTDGVVVSVVAFCWGGCDGGGQTEGSAGRPRPLEAVEFLGEAGVDSSGRWSMTVAEPQSQRVSHVNLLVWDEGGVLAPRYYFVWDPWGGVEFGDVDIGDADVELEAGGWVSGRFSTSDGGPPPGGDYALWGSGDWLLDVDPQTGEFTSPPVPPGTHRIAHAYHGEGFLGHNAAAEVEVAAGETADAGTVQIQQAGRITVAIADADGQPLQGVAVSGEISSQNPYWSMPGSPFGTSGTGYFWAATGDDGTHTTQNLYPGDWQIETNIAIPQQYTAITTGSAHTCAIAADQTIDCWGNNEYGQADAPDGQYTEISAGGDHTCAIAADYTIDCWGNNYSGQTDAPDGHYTEISAGGDHACAIAADQTIDCWGYNSSGQADAPDGQYTAIAAGHLHACAIAADQTIDCWGYDFFGQTDAPDGQYTAISAGSSCAIAVDQTIDCWGYDFFGQADAPDGQYDAPDGQYTAISAGGACAIAADHTINCWGNNEYGQADAPDGQYTAISAGGVHACAIAADNTIDCWGNNRYGQANVPVPVFDASAEGIAVAPGGTVDCTVAWNGEPELVCSGGQAGGDGDSDETATDDPSDTGGRASGRFTGSDGGPPPPGDYALWGWGSGDWLLDLDVDPQTGVFTSPIVAPGEYSLAHGNHGGGHLANNDAARIEIAAGQTADAGTVRVQQPGQIIVSIAHSDGQALQGIPVSGGVTFQNPYQMMPSSPFYNTTGTGVFGAATGDDGAYTAQNLYPGDDWRIIMKLPTDGQYTAIATGQSHSCAIAADNTIDCWGYNGSGRADAPDGQYTAIATGDDHSCAIAADQTIDCWGLNPAGQADAPDGQYTAIAAGNGYLCAIAADQTIDCWGYNGEGQADAPDGQYTAIAAGWDHTCAIAADNTIDCWGYNGAGQADAPDGQYTAIAAGTGYSCAIAVDNTIDCWGYNDDGRADAPDGQYTAISAGDGYSCAIAVDNTVNCWGENDYGQADAPDGQYTQIAADYSHSCAITVDNTIDCWGYNRDGQATPIDSTTLELEGVAVGSGGTTTVHITVSDSGVTTTDVSRTSGDSASDETDTDDPSNTGGGEGSGGTETEGDGDPSGETDTGDPSGEAEPEDGGEGSGEAEPEDGGKDSGEAEPEDDGAAERCFAVHQFGAEPVDVAKSADGEAVLAQLSWGFHDSIGCYLTLDEAALGVLQDAAAPEGFPAGDAGAAQRCFGHHKFGVEPVDVAKSADRQTVLAQVSWGYHESFGCYLALDPAATAALRAAHT
ncbi:hypothetical protein [Candidatus Poriferisocius sp.]|uniref:hypothetical protein n=1 Tax=Candidatus Poriferisocius sp. TaxID=3101276 RepID=UPI003B52D2D1